MEELLHKAIAKGDDEKVRQLIENGAAMDKLMGLRGTALCAAIADRRVNIAKYLIKAGCDVNGEDYDREPPLMLAMRKECFDIVKTLIEHPRCNVNKPDPLFKVSPLCFATKSNQTEVVDWLVNAKCDIDSKDADGNTALQLAIINGCYDIVGKLVRCSCDMNSENIEGFKPIHTVARTGDHKCLVKLLSPWISIDDQSIGRSFSKINMTPKQQTNISKFLNSVTKYKQETPILLAARGGHGELIKLLLACGADPDLGDYPDNDVVDASETVFNKNYRTTPLLRACLSYREGRIDLDIIQWFVDSGCNVDQAGIVDAGQEKLWLTPLLFAATFDLVDLSKLLVEHGADVNLVVGDVNPLYQAIFRKSVNVVWYFLNDCSICLDKVVGGLKRNYFHAAMYFPDTQVDNVLDFLDTNGCSVNASDSDGKTPLFLAVEKLNFKYVRRLLKLNADVTLCSLSGETPLHKSVELGAVDVSKCLLAHGANVNAQISSGMSPLDVALEDMEDDEHKELAILLLQNGAMVTKKVRDIVLAEGDVTSPYCVDESADSGDDGSASGSFSDSSVETNIFLEKTLKRLVLEKEDGPISLYMTAIISIRNYFREMRLPFKNISSLPLPKSLLDQVMLQ